MVLALAALHCNMIIFRYKFLFFNLKNKKFNFKNRDLKVDNVLLDKDGHAILCDFGLSREGLVSPGSILGFV